MKKNKNVSTLTVNAPNGSYEIWIRDSFADLANGLKTAGCEGHRICIVTDSTVAPLYLEELRTIAADCCSTLEVFEFEAGEQHKTLDTVRSLYEKLIQSGFDRKDCLIALGGGVVGDLTGFAAATYMRGIRFIQIPTTLLAQVDSSSGGKTGVDFDQYKNMIGAFHQPSLVYINCAVLTSLPEEQFVNGMGEVVKHGLILDADYYEWLIEHMGDIDDRDIQVLTELVTRSCEIKKHIVEKDPDETKGDRALLNFGHTLGHAIEKLKQFELLHGECVSLGMVAAAYISWKRGMIDEDEFYEIRDMNVGFGLPISFDGIAIEDIVAATKKDKKMNADRLTFVLLKKLGHACLVTDVTEEEMLAALKTLHVDWM